MLNTSMNQFDTMRRYPRIKTNHKRYGDSTTRKVDSMLRHHRIKVTKQSNITEASHKGGLVKIQRG